MKYIFTLLLSFLVFVSGGVALAATGDMTSDTVSDQTIASLKVTSVDTVDNFRLNVIFSERVNLDTVKLKITKQSDNSTLKIASLTGSIEDSSMVGVNLDTELQEGTAYTLTVISVVAESGAVITDGALAIRDFITPTILQKSDESLNAPTNPNAVMTTSTGLTPTTSGLPNLRPVDSTSETATGATPVVPVTEELPLTGMNPFFFLVVILPLAFLLMRKRTL
ncbi:MAG: hypothetical protein PHY14_03845 [Candidatus Gracilibacteria bacterium]|nr:hypothetical protein [Candidatus Gracilibacteria bacterium]